MRENGVARRFRPGWKMSLFVVLFLPLTLGLGSWQLNRAEEKRAFETAYLERIGARALPPGDVVADFQRLRLEGRYERGQDFLLDNQTLDGAIGFAVVSVFQAKDGRRWLINRGFLSGDRSRRSLPQILTPEGELTIVALAWPELGLLPVFGEDNWAEGWPKVIQRLEVARMATFLDNAVPWELRLEGGQPGVFEPASTLLNMPASKHTGYAVQWFGLAAALTIGFMIFGFRRDDRDT
ncbi:MAG: SURF1 family protein [Pseudomonadota bacterium]